LTNTFWKSRSVFVTGATGFMGGWLVKALIDRGADVVALVRDSNPRSMFMRDRLNEHAVTVNGCVEDENVVRRALAEYSVDTVFHLAAQPLVSVAKADPTDTLRVNVQGTWTVLEACRQLKVRHVLVASSDKAYGASPNLPYLESHPLEGRYPYDVSKSCADLLSRMYAETYQLPVCISRFGNLFGGGDLNFSRTIPGLIRATLNDEPFVIRSDGKFIRDFLYVKDAAHAYLHLAEKLAAGAIKPGEAFNLSLEIRMTVLEVVELGLKLMGRTDLKPVIQNIASAEIREQTLSAAKARRELGWEPAYSMEKALQETIDWYRDFFSLSANADAPHRAALQTR
jgi:CDP-glucose 4,6-dehydratase